MKDLHPRARAPSRTHRPRAPRPVGRRSYQHEYGFPVRGYRVYDLDYGDLAGPTEYSGRAGYAAADARIGYPRRRPSLAEIGREARRRREERWRRLYADDLGYDYGIRRTRRQRHRRRRGEYERGLRHEAGRGRVHDGWRKG